MEAFFHSKVDGRSEQQRPINAMEAEMQTVYYDFAKEFAKNPGLRFKKLTPGTSGKEFRKKVLEPIIKNDRKTTFFRMWI